jgi:hypothetical protein
VRPSRSRSCSPAASRARRNGLHAGSIFII